MNLVGGDLPPRYCSKKKDDLYSQLLSFEQRLDLLSGGSNSSANSASRGGYGGNGYHGGNRGGRDGGRSRGGRTGGGRGSARGANSGNRSNSGSRRNSGGRCQVCYKPNHSAAECWHRFDEDYVPEEKHVAAAAAVGYNVDTNWYADTGSTDHITSELDKLAMREKYWRRTDPRGKRFRTRLRRNHSYKEGVDVAYTLFLLDRSKSSQKHSCAAIKPSSTT
ncbi:unnamed protein product [Urochloa humidicola]